VGAVHRLPAGDELEEEDAEGEHVRLLVHDAVREVLRRQAPVTRTYSTEVARQCQRLQFFAGQFAFARHCIAYLHCIVVT
jgi:hypothetical protein